MRISVELLWKKWKSGGNGTRRPRKCKASVVDCRKLQWVDVREKIENLRVVSDSHFSAGIDYYCCIDFVFDVI